MISLCPACHAIISRTCVIRRYMPPLLLLLLQLWREQHPDGHKQKVMSFEDAAVITVLFHNHEGGKGKGKGKNFPADHCATSTKHNHESIDEVELAPLGVQLEYDSDPIVPVVIVYSIMWTA